jgi:hypothetical protein
MYIIQREAAEAYVAGKSTQPTTIQPPQPPQSATSGTSPIPTVTEGSSVSDGTTFTVPAGNSSRVTWQGYVPPQKWMNFYTKVLSKFATQTGLKLALKVEIAPEGGVSNQKVDEIKVALRELGLSDEVVLE